MKPTWKDIGLTFIGIISFLLLVASCFLFYNWLSLDMLLYCGWAVLAVSLLIGMLSRRAFERRGGAPEGQSWLNTRVLVDDGIYGVVRHPMYLSFILVILALMLLAQHWSSVVLGVPWILYLYLAMQGEEQGNVEKFGEEYRRYVTRVPRVNALAGIARFLQRRREIESGSDGQKE